MILFAFFSLGLLIWRCSQIDSPKIDQNVFSQGFGVIIGMIFLSLSAVLILLGTSSPILTGLFGNPSKVGTIYYIRTNLPLGILIALLVGVIPFLTWRSSRIAKKIFVPIIITVILTFLAFILGIRSLVYLLFICMGLFAFTANFFICLQRIKANLLTAGGFLTHTGLGLLLIGVITSSAYSSSVKINLLKGEGKNIWGYHLTYQGFDGEKLRVEIQKGKGSMVATPKFYYSDYTDGVVRTPHIDYSLSGDLYLAPLEIKSEQKSFVMKKGESIEFKDYRIKFLEFDMAPHSMGGKMVVGAELEVSMDEGKHTIVPTLIMGMEGEREQRGAELPKEDGLVYLEKIDADDKVISISIIDISEDASEALILELSRKPLIGLVWVGTIFMMIGLGITWRRRRKEVS
jgi:cytochrome c-type biogenesis protein CcmF